ncbi:MAG: hypothetical protein OEV20_02160 [Actinomycetota bacterium]|nr:hypothetical protein [Actinomycetota bacterium]MDH4016121.1 hypothetical protein [Actinomycetota bacterium]
MDVLTAALVIFGLLELMNVGVLYFVPGSRKANGVGVFTAWEKSKADPEVHEFVRYLVFWVAGTKVIFLGLLAVVLTTGSEQTKAAAAGVLAVSIALFFWRMFPVARQVDSAGQMRPAGYSRTLGAMIAAMVAVFVLGAALTL